MDGITIRPLQGWDEYHNAVTLQQLYWGDDAESIVPAHMLHSIAQYGGHVLGAFDGAKMVGVLIAFLGTDKEESDRPAMANLLIASKRICVLPDYQGRDIAYHLKLAQRDIAHQQGIRLIVWTFDPILSRNAHLNIRKLGAICRHFVPDYYGKESRYALAGMSDRLVAEWWITYRRVEERLTGDRSDLTLTHYLDANTRMVNTTKVDSEGLIRPVDSIVDLPGSLALLEIPTDFHLIHDHDAALAKTWRVHLRDMLSKLIGSGYIVTDFLRAHHEGRERAFYVFSWDYGAGFPGEYSRAGRDSHLPN